MTKMSQQFQYELLVTICCLREVTWKDVQAISFKLALQFNSVSEPIEKAQNINRISCSLIP